MAASLTLTRSITEIQNLLVCNVCKKTINEPKILPCSHSFCKACLDNLTTRDQENVDVYLCLLATQLPTAFDRYVHGL